MPNAVKPIPDNFHSLTPNLVCRNAAQAIEFYKAVFGATELMRMPGPAEKSCMRNCKLAIRVSS